MPRTAEDVFDRVALEHAFGGFGRDMVVMHGSLRVVVN